MKASELPWWGWLLWAAMFTFIGLDGLVGIFGKRAVGLFSFVLASAFVGIGILLAIVGIIRFFKWAWKD